MESYIHDSEGGVPTSTERPLLPQRAQRSCSAVNWHGKRLLQTVAVFLNKTSCNALSILECLAFLNEMFGWASILYVNILYIPEIDREWIEGQSEKERKHGTA